VGGPVLTKHIYATYALDTCFKMFMKGVSMPVGDGEGGRGDLLTTTSLSLTQIKTTAPLRYKVRPNLALIDPKSVAKIHVLLVPGETHCLTCS